MGPHKRGPWSQSEDQYLLQLVHSQGAHNWVRISQHIQTRSPKQCRERFHQNLKPSLNHDPITPDEGEIIERLVGEMGKRWAEIARRLRGRSDNAVKNWWNGGMNRRHRVVARREGNNRCPPKYNEHTEALSFARPINTTSRSAPSILVPSIHQTIEGPLISPATSDASMADSVGEVPSLISDSSSMMSTSPYASKSIHPLLHPPVTPGSESYRQSLPNILFENGPPFADQQYFNASARVGAHGTPGMFCNQRLYQFAEVATNSSPATRLPSQPHTTPEQQYQLPPFQTFIEGVRRSESPPSKGRMSVSALVD